MANYSGRKDRKIDNRCSNLSRQNNRGSSSIILVLIIVCIYNFKFNSLSQVVLDRPNLDKDLFMLLS